MIKLIAFYLPQFHIIPENNEWWGEGFTEWTNTKKARPLFRGHYQPRVPLHNDYYCLLDKNVMIRQMKLAQKYGIYGFCFYHYWYCGKKILEKPTEMLLLNKEANLPFCFAWANESWTKTWHGAKGSKEVLIKQTYGKQSDWKEHIQYLLNFFKDDRYIKIDNRPVLLILHLNQIKNLKEMLSVWNDVLQENGYHGIYLISMLRGYKGEKVKGFRADASMDFEPGRTINEIDSLRKHSCQWLSVYKDKFEKIPFVNRICRKEYDYEQLCKTALNRHHRKEEYWGIFTGYDDTPRRNYHASIVKNGTPFLFGKYLKEIINRSQIEKKEFIFITAWNEWGEGSYLEPDQRYGYAYLNEVRKAIRNK